MFASLDRAGNGGQFVHPVNSCASKTGPVDYRDPAAAVAETMRPGDSLWISGFRASCI